MSGKSRLRCKLLILSFKLHCYAKSKISVFYSFSFLCLITQAQNRTVKGKVVAASNNAPLAGASITVKGKTTGALTANDGSFSLSVPTGPVVMVVSSIGYATLEKSVAADESEITITLAEAQGNLNEVVVTALGITRQAKTLVYATQTV